MNDNSPEETTDKSADVLFNTDVLDRLAQLEARFETNRLKLAARGVRPEAYREALMRVRRMQVAEREAKRVVFAAMKNLLNTRKDMLRELTHMNQLLAILKEVQS